MAENSFKKLLLFRYFVSVDYNSNSVTYGPQREKTCLRTTKVQTSLRICTVWSRKQTIYVFLEHEHKVLLGQIWYFQYLVWVFLYSNIWMLCYRSWCPDRTIPQARKYISESMGPAYAESVILNLEGTWEESDPRTPLICFLSMGSDPTNQIENLAKKLQTGLLTTLQAG